MLQLILGGSGSGKTTRLYDAIEARAKKGEKSIILVPEQFTASTETHIYTRFGDTYSGFVESFSFTSLAERILTLCGGVAIKTLTDAGRAVLVRRALKGLEHEMQYYYTQRRNVAFCQMMAQTIDELKSAGLSAVDFGTYAKNCGANSEKLEELALVFGAYEAELAQTGLDPSDRVNLAAKSLAQAHEDGTVPAFLQDCAIYVDEFDTFNAPKQRLFSALFRVAQSITVSLCADDWRVCVAEPRHVSSDAAADADSALETADEMKLEQKADFMEDMSLFSGARRVAVDLRNLAYKAGVSVATPIVLRADLRHANAPALADVGRVLAGEAVEIAQTSQTSAQDVQLFAARSREEEVRAVTAEIQKLAREGVRYQNMAVVCRDVDRYRMLVRRECTLCDIPLFCDETTVPTFSAPVTAVRALLSILRGIDFSDQMVTLAKTGLCEIPDKNVSALEDYVYTWSPKAEEWRSPFTRNPDGFGELRTHATREGAQQEDAQPIPRAEQARLVLMSAIQPFCKKAKQADAQTLTQALYDCLGALGAQKAQQDQIAVLRRTKGIPAAEAAARAWNVLMDLLNQMVQLLQGERDVPHEEYAELFQLLLRSSDLGHIPQTLDAVIFASATKMRLDSPDYVFVLGLAEGEFPATPSESGLLTHADRDALMAQQVELPDCFENHMVREQVCFYKTLTAPAKRLWMSWPEGMGLPMSSSLNGIVHTVCPVRVEFSVLESANSPSAAIDRLGSLWGEDSVEAASLWEALQGQGGALEVALAQFEKQSENAPKQIFDLSHMQDLLSDTMEISPSKVERYYSCQYAYFLQYVLKLRVRQKAELSPNHSGSLIHWVLEKALDAKQEEWGALERKPFKTLEDSEIQALAETLAQSYRVRFMPDDSRRFAYLIGRLQKKVARLLCYLRDEQKQSSFHPVLCEAEIRAQEGDVAPREYALANGNTVRLIGKIDRIDTWQEKSEEGEDGKQWVRVVDYKTGSKEFNLQKVYCGLDCQMLLYLFAVSRDEQGQFHGVEPAGVLYMLADPAPQTLERDEASAELAPSFEGLLCDEERVYKAMDAEGEGAYLPFAHARADALTRAKEKSLVTPQSMGVIREHLDALVVDMAQSLYDGNIAAEPLCENANTLPCQWCDYRTVCGREEGDAVRTVKAPARWFVKEDVLASADTADVAQTAQADASAEKPEAENVPETTQAERKTQGMPDTPDAPDAQGTQKAEFTQETEAEIKQSKQQGEEAQRNG